MLRRCPWENPNPNPTPTPNPSSASSPNLSPNPDPDPSPSPSLKPKPEPEQVPVETRAVDGDGTERTVVVSRDEGPRAGTSLEKLATLKAVFKPNGSVTAGTSSQVSDGAAAVLLMSRAKARQLGVRPLGALRCYLCGGHGVEVWG